MHSFLWGGLLVTASMLLASGCRVNHLVQVVPANVRMVSSLPVADTAILALIEPYQTQITREMNEVIGQLETPLEDGGPESTLGNWAADLLFDGTQRHYDKPLDAAFINGGGLRIPGISPGPITKRIIFELMPFDNTVEVVILTGQQLRELLVKISEGRSWSMSRGIRYEIYQGKVRNIQVQGKPLDLEKDYQIVLLDYITNGGGGINIFATVPKKSLGLYLRDLLIEEITLQTQQGKVQRGMLDERVKVVNQ